MTEDRELELICELVERTIDLVKECTPEDGIGIAMSSTLTIVSRVAELIGEDPQQLQRKILQETLAQL